MWRQYHGQQGPRPPPVLNMLPASRVGEIHRVTTSNSHWSCGNASNTQCSPKDPMTLEIECVSLFPRAFIIENFLSELEADHIISIAQSRVKLSTVGTADGGGIRASDTRTSKNTWLNRQTSPIIETITRRVADSLGKSCPSQDFIPLHSRALKFSSIFVI
jgi:hypothetical protein